MSETYFPQSSECPTHNIFPGVTVSTWWGEKLMVSLAELQPHSVVEEHQHPHEQLGIVLEGRAIFIIGGVERTLKPGDRFRIPGNVRHKVIALDQPVKAIDVFSPPREEYK